MRGQQLREADKKKKREAAAEVKRTGAPAGTNSPETETAPGIHEGPTRETNQKQRTLEVNVEAGYYERLRKLSDLAAEYQVIPNDHRGNITAWVRWCLDLGEQTLRQYAMKRRGYS